MYRAMVIVAHWYLCFPSRCIATNWDPKATMVHNNPHACTACTLCCLLVLSNTNEDFWSLSACTEPWFSWRIDICAFRCGASRQTAIRRRLWYTTTNTLARLVLYIACWCCLISTKTFEACQHVKSHGCCGASTFVLLVAAVCDNLKCRLQLFWRPAVNSRLKHHTHYSWHSLIQITARFNNFLKVCLSSGNDHL